MSLTLDAERRELRAVARRFFTDLHDEPALRRAIAEDPGWDRQTWTRLSEQLGVCGMAVPEEYGGAGFTHLDLGLVLEEAGAALYTAPLFSTAVVADVVAAGDDGDLAAEVIPRLAERAGCAAFALTESAGGWHRPPRTTVARRDGGGWVLDGRKVHVIAGGDADVLVVSADVDGGERLFLIDGAAPGVVTTPVAALDPTRRQVTLELHDAPARAIDTADRPLAARLRAVAAVHLAAEQVGGAARALTLAVDYSRTREQYGRPIGSFQALKHLCADHLAAIETARSAVLSGLAALDAGSSELPDVASAARVFCSETFTACASSCIQIHGGIGFTWEHPAHFFYKRARSSEVLLGSPSAHRAVLAARLGL